MSKVEMHDGEVLATEEVRKHTQNLQDDLEKFGRKIKHHEDNMKFLKKQMNHIDDSILDLQVNLGKYHTSSLAEESNNISLIQTERRTVEDVLHQEKTAAGIICQIKNRHGLQASKLPSTKDVLGVVATLGKVNDDNISRLFSEFLGLETMMAIVCKTYEGVKALEMYDEEGTIDKNAGLHGLGPSIGRLLDGRFLVFCLDSLRPYVGEFVADDPQKKLALLKPRLPTGDCPPGFLGFAVNMINLDHMYLSYLTSSGHGLRETLFYSLFSRLQVYKTRVQMQRAMPCISDGAISLDGGMIRSGGLFLLGDRKDVEVRFPTSSGISSLPADVMEIQKQIKLMNWKKERLTEDIQREEVLLNSAKGLFKIKKEEFVKCLADTRSYLSQAAKPAILSQEKNDFKSSSLAS